MLTIKVSAVIKLGAGNVNAAVILLNARDVSVKETDVCCNKVDVSLCAKTISLKETGNSLCAKAIVGFAKGMCKK